MNAPAKAARVSVASAAAIQAAYKIEVQFLGGLSESQMKAFKAAADRWSRVSESRSLARPVAVPKAVLSGDWPHAGR